MYTVNVTGLASPCLTLTLTLDRQEEGRVLHQLLKGSGENSVYFDFGEVEKVFV